MRFLIVVHYSAPHIGGMEMVVAKQAQSLIERGHEVTVVTCRSDKKCKLYKVQKNGVVVKRFRAFNAVETVLGVTFPIISPHHLFWFLRHVRDYDIVHIHDVFYISSWLATTACRLRNKPYFLTQHVGIVDHPSRLVLAIEDAVYALFGNKILRHAQKVVAYNDAVVKFLQLHGVKKSNIVQNYNGIDTDYFTPATRAEKTTLRKQYGFKARDHVVLFVGRLVPKKGFQIVLDGANTHNTYVFAGSGITPKQYEDLPNITFFGPASQAQLRDLYRLSDVFVFPSVGEVFTLVHQEALASGLPVIVADDPGYAKYDIDRSRMLLADRTPDAIADAIETVLDDNSLARRMSRYGRELAVQRFSWRHNYPKEYQIYSEAMGNQ